MGGAGVIRSAAAKVASFRVFNNGRRVVPSSPATENFYAAPRSPTCSASSILSSSSVEPEASVVKFPLWNAHDWYGEELISDEDYYQLPRLVFGGPPSFEEAKSATADLEIALDNVSNFPPNLSGSSPILSKSPDLEDSLCITTHDLNPAFQALKLLKENYAAQRVVASIASDPNVWDAFMQNTALTEFLETHTKTNEGEEVESNNEMNHEGAAAEVESVGFMVRAKKSILEMVKMASDLLWPKTTERPQVVASDMWESFPSSIGRSLLALAMMVIMMVLLKRV